MTLSADAAALADRVTTIQEGRDMLSGAIRTLDDAWNTKVMGSDLQDALRSLLTNTMDYATSILADLQPLDGSLPVTPLQKKQVGLAVARAAEAVRVVASDAFSASGLAEEFIDSLGSAFQTVIERTAAAAGRAALSAWPIWTIVAVVLGAWILLRREGVLA